ncbi:MAG: hypothetical protein NDI74_14950, partial [Sphingomonas sp.]|uniref:hypothetical protein n=1 Tax=Sphingomonas sp. TaxID=28214 RepID=UPI0025848407
AGLRYPGRICCRSQAATGGINPARCFTCAHARQHQSVSGCSWMKGGGHVIATCRAAWKLSRNPMAMLLPLICEHWSDAGHQVVDDALPPVQMIDGVPGYALDQFTRIGNSVSRAMLREDGELRQMLNDAGIPLGQQARAVGDLLFISEGGLLTNRAIWGIGDQLRLPERSLPSVAKLAECLPKAMARLTSNSRQIALLREQHFHPGIY